MFENVTFGTDAAPERTTDLDDLDPGNEKSTRTVENVKRSLDGGRTEGTTGDESAELEEEAASSRPHSADDPNVSNRKSVEDDYNDDAYWASTAASPGGTAAAPASDDPDTRFSRIVAGPSDESINEHVEHRNVQEQQHAIDNNIDRRHPNPGRNQTVQTFAGRFVICRGEAHSGSTFTPDADCGHCLHSWFDKSWFS